EQERMLTEDHCNRKGFSRPHRLLVMHLAVLTRRDIETYFVLVLQHDAVAANVFHTGFRIPRDDEMWSSEITAAVAFMPTRHGKFEEIDLIASFNIFHHGSGRKDCRFDRLKRP